MKLSYLLHFYMRSTPTNAVEATYTFKVSFTRARVHSILLGTPYAPTFRCQSKLRNVCHIIFL